MPWISPRRHQDNSGNVLEIANPVTKHPGQGMTEAIGTYSIDTHSGGDRRHEPRRRAVVALDCTTALTLAITRDTMTCAKAATSPE